jgi:glycosyltransferase involved in cell wall biosynthesis
VNRSRDLAGCKVAILAPISTPAPPDGYGPWEQVAANIATGMGARGLDVTLFAAAGSSAPVRIAAVIPRSLGEDPHQNGEVATALHIASLFERAGDFDLIHNNFDWKPLTYALCSKAPPMVTTVHGFSSPPILAAYYAGARRSFYCSISDADRDPGLAYLSTVYNGIDPADFPFNPRAGDYLVSLGRIHPEKGAHLAVEIAKRSGVRLKLAAIPQDERYFREQIEPHIDGDRVQFLGHLRSAERNELLAGALALVHMTTRPERFGLVLTEAMACGTPVLGARMGSLPEIVLEGETGFLCATVDEAVARVPQLATLDRTACRRRVESAFSIDRMIDGYCDAYRAALAQNVPPPATPSQLAWRAKDWWDRPQAFTDLPPRPIGNPHYGP